MSAPNFRLSNIPLMPGHDYMNAVVAEENRVCAGIDKRIDEVKAEYYSLSNQMRAMTDALERNKSFFTWLSLTIKLHDIASLMSRNRSILVELYDARWRRTYG